jgi:hypothetical protein
MESNCDFFVTPYGAKSKCAYLLNPDHPNHHGKEIQARQVGTRIEFELGLATAVRGDGKIRRGRKPRYAAVELVGSTPFECWLTDPERRMIENAVVTELDLVTCLLVWHDDNKKGRNDFHVITPNRDSQGRLLTARERGNLLFHFRSIMDRVHNSINQARRKLGQDHIETMPEARTRIREEGRALLLEELARADVALSSKAIVTWLRDKERLGKRCRLKGADDDYVSVIYKAGYRGRRENLEALIMDALERRKKLRLRQNVEESLEFLRRKAKKLNVDKGNQL